MLQKCVIRGAGMDKTVDNILQEYDLIRAMSCYHREKKSAVQLEHCLLACWK